MPTIDQGGNTFGAEIHIGTNDNYAVNIKTNNTTKVTIAANGVVSMKRGLQFNKETNDASGAISWYSPNYKGWTTYMAYPGSTGNGVNANITAPTGTIVTSWALRNFIENNLGYGFTWETGLSTGNPSAVIMELEANTGNLRLSSLAGTGDRMVTADSTGTLSANTIVDSGLYTPAATMSPSGTATAHGFTYIRVGKIVTVTGLLGYTGASAGASLIEIPMPIPSTLVNNEDLVGVVTGTALSAASPNYVVGDTGNNVAQVNFSSVAGAGSVYVQFQYQVI